MSKTRKMEEVKPKIFRTDIMIPIKNSKKIMRADLEFYGINHAGLSYEARMFLNNKNANEKTKKIEKMVMPDPFTYLDMVEDVMEDQDTAVYHQEIPRIHMT